MTELNTCRLCLNNADDCLDITIDESHNICLKIEKFLYLQIGNDDPFPKMVCQKCVQRLQQFNEYCNEVAENQQILMQLTQSDDEQQQIITITNELMTKTSTPAANVLQFAPGFNLKDDGSFVITLQAATTPSTVDNTIDLQHYVGTNDIEESAILSNNRNLLHDTKVIVTNLAQPEINIVNDESKSVATHPIKLNDSNGYFETAMYPCLASTLEMNILNDELKSTEPNSDQNIYVTVNSDKVVDAKHDMDRIKYGQRKSKNEDERAKNQLKLELTAQIVDIEKPDVPAETFGTNDQLSCSIERELDDLHDDDDVTSRTIDDSDDEIDSEDTEFGSNLSDIDIENHRFKGFPRQIIKDTKLLIHGKQLVELMSKFYRLECDQCVILKNRPQFERLGELCHHYVSEHTMKGYVTCCGSKLIKPRAMALHMARHLQPDAFKCPQCDKMLTCPKILQYHVQNHLPEKERPLACTDCTRRFSYSSALVAHSISHQPENERAAHVCDECGKVFVSAGRLTTHINVTHMLHGQDFICHICAKQFACRSNLTYHLTTHQPSVRQVQCQKCGKWLKNKLCLRKHMVQHSTIRYSCSACNYSALNRQCLRNHINVQHSNAKPFGCEVCGKNFKLKNTLLSHMAQHTGVRKFTCPFCVRTFVSSGNYYSHRKRMHPQELAEMKLKLEEDERILREQTLKSTKI